MYIFIYTIQIDKSNIDLSVNKNIDPSAGTGRQDNLKIYWF